MTNLRQQPAAEAQQLKTPAHALLPRIRQALGPHACILSQERLLHAAHDRRKLMAAQATDGAQRDLRPTGGRITAKKLQPMFRNKQMPKNQPTACLFTTSHACLNVMLMDSFREGSYAQLAASMKELSPPEVFTPEHFDVISNDVGEDHVANMETIYTNIIYIYIYIYILALAENDLLTSNVRLPVQCLEPHEESSNIWSWPSATKTNLG